MMPSRYAVVLTALALFSSATQSSEPGWYGRVDAGRSFPTSPGVHNKDDYAGMFCADLDCNAIATLNQMEGTFFVEAGGGYDFGSGLRTDAKLAFRPLYSVDEFTNPIEHYHLDVKSWALTTNAYYGPYTFFGFTPYLGAGLGAALNHVTSMVQQFTAGFSVTVPGKKIVQRVFSLTAGVSYEVAPGWTADLAYRYSDLGRFDTGEGGTPSVPFGSPILFWGAEGHLRVHELTLGVRF